MSEHKADNRGHSIIKSPQDIWIGFFIWRSQNCHPSLLKVLSAWLAWLQEQPGVPVFWKLRLQRNLIVYELVSIWSKLCCLLPELGSHSSFHHVLLLFAFLLRKRQVMNWLYLTYICSICRGMSFPEIPFIFFPWHKDFSMSSLGKSKTAQAVMTSPDIHPAPSQGLCLQLPTNLCRGWRARNSLHPQPELKMRE